MVIEERKKNKMKENEVGGNHGFIILIQEDSRRALNSSLKKHVNTSWKGVSHPSKGEK
jgi:hypothetical protein